jgi:hypothetical protein
VIRSILQFHVPRATCRMPVFAAILIMALLAGCAGKPGTRWYKEGSGQADFDRDGQECRILAEEFGRQATLSSKRPDLETQTKTYHQCLFAKGWSHLRPATPGEQEPRSISAQATVGQGAVTVFGKRLPLPQGFTQTGSSASVQGPFAVQSLSFRGPGPVFLSLILQQGRTLPFEPIPYPVEEPFFLYDRGSTGAGIEWSAFFGRIRGSWVAGIGTYLHQSGRERTTIVLTAPLPPHQETPPPGLRLDSGQRTAMETFMATWIPWIESLE